MKTIKLSLLTAAFVGLLVACNKNESLMGDSIPGGRLENAGGASTGQGIDVELNIDGNFVINEQYIYHFDQNAAKGYYTTSVSAASVEVTQGTCSAPAAPAAPAADGIRNNQLQEDKCTFFNGGAGGQVYSYTKSSTGNNGLTGKNRCAWKYTWTYTVSRVDLEPKTAWTETVNTGENPTVTIAPSIAGLSVMTNNQHPLPGKASFSLLNGDGTSRIQNLVLNVDGVDYALNHSVISGVDFFYRTNAGSNGDTGLLSPYENKFASTILNSDSFDNNNDISNAVCAKADVTSVQLGVGSHTIRLTGVVKGNSASADAPIDVTKNITISAEGCQ